MDSEPRGYWRDYAAKAPPWFSIVEDGAVLHAIIKRASVMDVAVMEQIESHICRRLKPGKALLIDCASTVKQISTDFLNLLIRLQGVARRRGGTFAVCGLLPAIVELLELTALNRRIAMFETAEPAFTALARKGAWDAGVGDEIGMARSPVDGLKRWFSRLSRFSNN